MDFLAVLKRVTEDKQKDILVRIKGTKTSDGTDLYDRYRWFHDMFPNDTFITGILVGSAGDSILKQDLNMVQFAIVDGKRLGRVSGHKATFRDDQIERLN
jgi:hypothetical protein